MNPREMFKKLDGKFYTKDGKEHDEYVDGSFPAIHAEVYYTIKDGVPYLKEAGVVMVNKPDVCFSGMRRFLQGFGEELDFGSYLDDPQSKEDAAQLVKFCGQLCYLSFGPARSRNVEIKKYLDNIKSSGHGSVLEHAGFSFLLYGIDRSVTHEAVRHRVGIAYSQVSQRYVSGKTLRFVERPEYQDDVELHSGFENWVQTNVQEYDRRATLLEKRQSKNPKFESMTKTEKRKAVNQAARASLANETEAPIFISPNIRTLRHLTEMRVSEHADIQIRKAFFKMFLCTVMIEPTLFDDYEIIELPDGTYSVKTPHRKV